jgi:hypothetical protein
VKGRALRSRLIREEGQALVEFLAILPIFLVITFGVIEFGKGLNYWIDLTHLSNEGVRYAAVDRWPGCQDGGGCTPAALSDYLKQVANTEELSDAMDVEICFPEGTSEIGDAVRVSVDTTYTLAVVDGLLSFVGADEVGQLDLRSSATMRLEQLPERLTAGEGSIGAC